MGCYTAELHGATFSDWPPAELHCLGAGAGHSHYATQPAGTRVAAYPVERTDDGTGPVWYATGGSFCFTSREAAAQWLSDLHLGVTRIKQDSGVVERWLKGRRLPDGRD
jgi:hypothetical protein